MDNQADEIQVQLEEVNNEAENETVTLEEAESTEVNSGDSDDELDRYTRGVSKRINKLTAKYKVAEDIARS
jgi:low affinity Fe/Cu permease